MEDNHKGSIFSDFAVRLPKGRSKGRGTYLLLKLVVSRTIEFVVNSYYNYFRIFVRDFLARKNLEEDQKQG